MGSVSPVLPSATRARYTCCAATGRQSNKPSKKNNLFIPYTMNYLNPSHIIYIRYARAKSTSQPAAQSPAVLPMAKVRLSECKSKKKSNFFIAFAERESLRQRSKVRINESNAKEKRRNFFVLLCRVGALGFAAFTKRSD